MLRICFSMPLFVTDNDVNACNEGILSLILIRGFPFYIIL
jgi:hypothetical protein